MIKSSFFVIGLTAFAVVQVADTGVGQQRPASVRTDPADESYDPLAGENLPSPRVRPSRSQIPIQPEAINESNANEPSRSDLGSSNPETTTVRIDGTLHCVHKVNIAAHSDGLIEELLVDEFSEVQAGDRLLKIDDRLAQADVDVAEMELAAAEKQAEQTAEIEHSQAAAEVSKAEYEAERELQEKGSSTFSQTRRKWLEAKRAALGVDVAKVEKEKAETQADVARAKLEAAKVRLDLYEVVAPYDGIIVERQRDQGEWIRSGETVLRLVNMEEMKFSGDLDIEGRSLADIKGAPMRLYISVGSKQYTIDGQIEHVSPELFSRKASVGGRIENVREDNSVWLFGDGMSVTIEIELPTRS